jgi:hypothetical protein
MALRVFTNEAKEYVRFEQFSQQVDKHLNLTTLHFAHAYVETNEDIRWLLCFLLKNPAISKLKIQKSKIQKSNFFTYLDVSLSECVGIRDLTLLGLLVCTSLPPHLEFLETETCNLLSPFRLPLSVKTFCHAEFCYTVLRAPMKCEIDILVLNNPQLTNIIFNHSGKQSQSDLFYAIAQRTTPLDFLQLEYGMEEECQDHLLIAFKSIRCLKAHLSRSLYSVKIDGPIVLRKFIDTGKPFFPTMTQWTTELEEFYFRFPCSDGFEFDGFQSFLSSHKKLKKIRYEYPSVPHCRTMINATQYFPFLLIGEIQCWTKKDSRMMLKICKEIAGEDTSVWMHKKNDQFIIQFCRNMSWLPRLHMYFPENSQQMLATFALGLKRLKKEKDLVHVDPACIEWMLEEFHSIDIV